MKSKLILTLIIGFLCFGLFFCIFVDTIVAQDYQISIVDKSYNIHKIREIQDQTFIYYNISITLRNSGNSISDDITVRIMDEDGNYTRNGTIMPDESKTFLFDDHPLLGMTDHTIFIYFYPTDKPDSLDDYHHGEDVLILKYGGDAEDGNTPGFEAVFLFVVIVGYVVIRKYKK